MQIKDTQSPKQKNDVEAQTSPTKETSSHLSESDTEPLLENQTRSIPVQSPNDSKEQQNEIQRDEKDLKTYGNGDDNISLPEVTASQIEERLVRDDITNELYILNNCLKTKGRNVVCPSGFQEWFNNRCPC